MLPEKQESIRTLAIEKYSQARVLIESSFPLGVLTPAEDEKAKSFLQTIDKWHDEYKRQRMEITKQFDETKKLLMEPEKDFKSLSDKLRNFRDEFANSVRQQQEVESYKEEFETVLRATLQTLALEGKKAGRKAKSIDLSKVFPVPLTAHLKDAHVHLCLEWQPKANNIYSKYYKEAPDTVEEQEEVKEAVQVQAEMKIAEKKNEALQYKPKGSREVKEVSFTSAKGLGAVLRLFFNEKGIAVLDEKVLVNFISKYAATLPDEALAGIEGVTVVKKLKTSKR